jgi:predicted nucleotidyltransferase
MGLFQQIAGEAKKCNLQFLVIGGLAVNFYGYSRDTADLDLLIHRDMRDRWMAFFLEINYSLYQEKGAFIQFSPPEKGTWPVDLMMVREPTFRPIFDFGKEVEMYGAKLLIPTLEHLIALKLHALKHSHLGRYLKDFLDVENLVRINRIDLKSDKTRRMFLKYGTLEIYEKVSQACSAESF